MKKILNSLEELYQLISGTLPEGFVEYNPYVNWDRIINHQYGALDTRTTCYFIITEVAPHDRLKIEYGTRCMPIVTDGRIYKYV